MSPPVEIAENGDGCPIAIIGNDSGHTYEEAIGVYREADGGGDWSIVDEGGDDEADGESRYGFSGESDDRELTISSAGSVLRTSRFSSVSNHAGETRVTDHENPHTANTKQ